MNAPDLVGQRFGGWLVLERAESFPERPQARWLCQCACGETRVVFARNLRHGASKSCGCKAWTANGHRSGGVWSSEYSTWNQLRHRCLNPTNKSFKNYGGRGITVCDEWAGPHGFVAFLAHVGPKPGPEYSIDRIDNDGNYEPGNVRWATKSEQTHNRRISK